MRFASMPENWHIKSEQKIVTEKKRSLSPGEKHAEIVDENNPDSQIEKLEKIEK